MKRTLYAPFSFRFCSQVYAVKVEPLYRTLEEKITETYIHCIRKGEGVNSSPSMRVRCFDLWQISLHWQLFIFNFSLVTGTHCSAHFQEKAIGFAWTIGGSEVQTCVRFCCTVCRISHLLFFCGGFIKAIVKLDGGSLVLTKFITELLKSQDYSPDYSSRKALLYMKRPR